MEGAGMDEICTNGMSRRQALRRGAAVVGTALWVVPAMQMLTVAEASAQAPSGHYDSGRGNGERPVGGDLDPGNSGKNKGGG
ncbi:MAG: hypothetical protein ACRD1K_21175 [Acidimicrobiales bacterium]